MGVGLARLVAALLGRRNRQDAYQNGFDYADKLLKANEGGPAMRSTVDLLMQEAYLSEKQDNMSAKARSEGIYAAMADYRQDFGNRGL